MSSTTPASRAKACTKCRQVKLKCDSGEKFPASCSRCTLKGLECRMDANFKRVPTRNKLEEVTSELTSLKEAMRTNSQSAAPGPSYVYVSNQPQHRSHSSVSPIDRGGSAGSHPDLSGSLAQSILEASFYQIDNSDNAAFSIGQQHIGDVVFDGHLIVELFKHFHQNYYVRHELVLDISLSLTELIRTSPILFWAIVFTSSRYHPLSSAIFTNLISPFEQLLASYLIRPMHSISTIHAFLILVSWPLPNRMQIEDPTWNICGLITNAAQAMGLNVPGKEKEYGFPRTSARDVELRSRTWLTLFHRNITITTRSGLPPSLSNEATLRGIAQISSSVNISGDLKSQLDMLRPLATFTCTLRATIDPNTRDSLILMAIGELEAIYVATYHEWSTETQLQYLGHKMFLYGFSFHPRTQDDFVASSSGADPDLSISKKLILYAALSTATSYIHTFSQLRSNSPQFSSQQDSLPNQIHCPKQYFFESYHAALILYTFLSRLPHAPAPDQDHARNAIRTVHSILSANSLGDPKSQWARVAQSVELVGLFYNRGYKLPREKDIYSRGGAGLFYDAMMKIGVVRAEWGGRSHGEDVTRAVPDGTPSSDRETVEVNHDTPAPGTNEDNRFVGEAGNAYLTVLQGGMQQGSVAEQDNGHGNGNENWQVSFEQPYMMNEEWGDPAMWAGWDMNLLSKPADVQMDWDGLRTW